MVRLWLLIIAAAGGVLAAQARDPFAFYSPGLDLSPRERSMLRRGEAIVKMLPYGERELATFSAVQANVTGDRLAQWVHAIEDLKRSASVPALGRFSDPPALGDLDGLELDEDDVEAVSRCRPGSCDVKLSAAEIDAVRAAARDGGREWRASVQEAFRRLILARTLEYRAGGLDALQPYHDQEDPTPLAGEFDALVASSPYLAGRVPHLVSYFSEYPANEADGVESFLYWSKEALGGKPVIALTHVAIFRPEGLDAPELLVASRQFYATHYLTGSLALTAIVGGQDGQPRYLAYLNRSRVDVLGGVFGRIARLVIERRLRSEATEVVDSLRRRLESGTPPRVVNRND
jgi:hypothetical protein